MKSVRISLTELWGHPSPHLGDARVPDGASSDPCAPGLRKLPPHSPRPAQTSGRAPAAPLTICQAAPLLRRGALPRPSSCQPPSLLADKPGQTAGPACPRSRASSAKPGGAGGPRRCQLPESPRSPAALPPACPSLLPAPFLPRALRGAPSGPSSRPSARVPPVSPAPSLGAFQSGFGLLGLRPLLGSVSLTQILAPSFLAALSLGTGPALCRPVPSSLAFLHPLTPGSRARGGGQVPSGRSSPPGPWRPLRSYQLLFEAAQIAVHFPAPFLVRPFAGLGLARASPGGNSGPAPALRASRRAEPSYGSQALT